MSTPTEPYRYDDNNGVTVRRIQPPWFYFVGNRYSLATATSIPWAVRATYGPGPGTVRIGLDHLPDQDRSSGSVLVVRWDEIVTPDEAVNRP